MTTVQSTAVSIVAAGLGLAVLWWRTRRLRPLAGRSLRLGWADVAAPFLAAGAALAPATLAVMLSTSHWFFGVAHLAYLGLTVTAPVVALGLLGALAWRRGPLVAWGVTLVVLLLAPVGWYATHVVPYDLRVDRAMVVLPAARAGRAPIRVGVLADLQTNRIGPHERRAVTTLLAQRPDIIVLTGDLFQGNDTQFRRGLPEFRALLGTLRAPGGVFAVQGDSEPESELYELTEGTRIRVLDNDLALTQVGDREVAVGGNRLRWAPVEGVALRDRLKALDPKVVRVLVAHRPELVLNLPDSSGIDLFTAGHTHGGQVALPLVGPLVTFSPVARRVAAGGLHDVRGNPIYVSTGVGLVRDQAPQVRFGVRPSVGIVTLR